MPKGSPWLLPLATVAVALTASGCGSPKASVSRILFLSDWDGAWSLYTMTSDGRAQKRLALAGRADPSASGVGIGGPLVSPDGRSALIAHPLTPTTRPTRASRAASPSFLAATSGTSTLAA